MLGIYNDVGTETCGGYPGTRNETGFDFTQIDAKTFSDWKVGSLKLDGWYFTHNQNLFTFTNLIFVLKKCRARGLAL